jgi:hypothetical protein
MRTKALPQTVLNKLGLTTNRSKEAAPFLKKVQALYCDRLTRHRLCPLQCWRCAARLEQMADQMGGAENSIGFWHRICQDTAASIIEEYYEHQSPQTSKAQRPTSAGEMATRFMQQLTRDNEE